MDTLESFRARAAEARALEEEWLARMPQRIEIDVSGLSRAALPTPEERAAMAEKRKKAVRIYATSKGKMAAGYQAHRRREGK